MDPHGRAGRVRLDLADPRHARQRDLDQAEGLRGRLPRTRCVQHLHRAAAHPHQQHRAGDRARHHQPRSVHRPGVDPDLPRCGLPAPDRLLGSAGRRGPEPRVGRFPAPAGDPGGVHHHHRAELHPSR